MVTIAPPPDNLTYITYWSNDGTSVAGSEPTAAISVNVANGLFTIALGDTNMPGMAAVDASVFCQPNLQLRIWFDDGVHGSAALNPVQNLTATPYASVATAALGLAGVLKDNTIGAGFNATVGGGLGNICSNFHATVGGGYSNTASGYNATVCGGALNVASGSYNATVCGGAQNVASGAYSAVLGGDVNVASGSDSVACGGEFNLARGDFSFAAGHGADALHSGSFVWSDSSGGSFASTANNQFCVRAAGGLLFAGDVAFDTSAYHHLSLSGGNSLGFLYGAYETNLDGINLSYNYYASAPTGGAHIINPGGGTSRITVGYGEIDLAVGGVNSSPSIVMLRATTSGVCVNGTVNNCSDRNVKQDFAPVSPSEILDRVVQLPVSEWGYKMDAATRHIGPMAQDFYAAFNVGSDDKHLAPIDESGVALAAIQGLNQKLTAELEQKQTEITELKHSLSELKDLIAELAAHQKGDVK
jgi:hypothetical protein